MASRQKPPGSNRWQPQHGRSSRGSSQGTRSDSSSVQDDSLSQQRAIPDALPPTHQPNCSEPTLLARPSLAAEQGGRILGAPAALFTSHRSENVQSSEQMCWENSWHSPAWSWWPGSVLGSWERGKRSQASRLQTQQLTPPLISISSSSHKPKRLTFQHGRHASLPVPALKEL
ncbi:unnamed protein product [Pleuronectes platessa]|uniref:Uncharacterized protein n=1 Tax=Pleuronectes platessa TaxID=8262 RepID=A0A9N7YRQ9_PLEPL|nr:unnamed protein product [Pleuronectes platessa]